VTWSADSIVLSSTVLSSSVWQHFRKLDMSADGQTDPVCSQLRVCNICLEEAKNDKTINFMVEVDGSNTTKMINHMQKCHKGVVANDRAKAVKEHVKQGSTLEKYLNHGGQFMTSYLKWIVMTYQPIATCEDPYFRAMITSVNSHVPPLGRAKVTSLIKDTSEFVKQTLILALVGMYCALTTDHWTSVANVSYLAATVHFINENWELISFTLSCSEHSGASKAPDVLRELKKAWEAFGITTEFLMAVVSDTAPVMAAFGRLMYEDYAVSHVYCAAHVLELTTGTTFISLFYHLLLILINYANGINF
jgi:BED zinc finger